MTVNNISAFVYQYTAERSDIISNDLINGKSWEPEEIDAIIKALKSPPITPVFDPPIFVDVGANIGWITLSVAAAGYKVVSFEALPDNLIMLRHSVCLNPAFLHNVTVLPFGLGNSTATCYMVAASNSLGDGIMHCGVKSGAEAIKRSPKVPAGSNYRYMIRGSTRIRRMADIIQIPIKVMKIDVEGHEHQVLAGGQRLFERQLVQHVVTEVHGPFLGGTQEEAYNYLSKWGQLGYRISLVGFEGPWLDEEGVAATAKRMRDRYNVFATLDPSKLRTSSAQGSGTKRQRGSH